MKPTYLLLLSLLVFSGCQFAPPFMFPYWGATEVIMEPAAPTHQVFLTPEFSGQRPRRVVLISSNRNAGNYDANDKLIAELAARFRADGLCEVVTPNIRLPGHLDNIQQGRFDERDLAQISRKFNADAVALVRVNELRTYSPIRTSITLAFIDSNESVIACGVDGVWDLASVDTRQQFMNYLAPDGRESLQQLNLQSPNALFRFVATQVSQSIIQSGF